MNWKCNPKTLREANALATASDVKDVVICPPAAFLKPIAEKLKNAFLGAQNGFWQEGPYTGESSFGQLKSIGVKYAIIGHSERRWRFGETSKSVSQKTLASLRAGITPIVCVGEKERKNISSAVKTVISQLTDSLMNVPKEKAGKIILAYEPVWAISSTGGGRNATLHEMEPLMAAVGERFEKLFNKKARVLYGGSVNPENAHIYAEAPNVYGVLVGNASIDKRKASAVIKKFI